MGAMRALSLRQVLDEIWLAEALPPMERRKLAHAAVARSQVGQTDAEAPITAETNALEEALVAVAGALGRTGKLTVQDAKAALRGTGEEGARVASRLGRLSKLRNGKCHPDVGLLHDIAATFRNAHNQAGKPQDEPSDQASTCEDNGSDDQQNVEDCSAMGSGTTDVHLQTTGDGILEGKTTARDTRLVGKNKKKKNRQHDGISDDKTTAEDTHPGGKDSDNRIGHSDLQDKGETEAKVASHTLRLAEQNLHHKEAKAVELRMQLEQAEQAAAEALWTYRLAEKKSPAGL